MAAAYLVGDRAACIATIDTVRARSAYSCVHGGDRMPDIVNPQITDAVTQANTSSLGDAPAMALSALYQATAQALALAAHNATVAQQNANTILQATTTQGVALIYSVDTAATAVATQRVFDTKPDGQT